MFVSQELHSSLLTAEVFNDEKYLTVFRKAVAGITGARASDVNVTVITTLTERRRLSVIGRRLAPGHAIGVTVDYEITATVQEMMGDNDADFDDAIEQIANALASSASGTGDGSFMTTLIAEATSADKTDVVSVFRDTTAENPHQIVVEAVSTDMPSSLPSGSPSRQPSSVPTIPTSQPSEQPSSAPSEVPTALPSTEPGFIEHIAAACGVWCNDACNDEMGEISMGQFTLVGITAIVTLCAAVGGMGATQYLTIGPGTKQSSADNCHKPNKVSPHGSSTVHDTAEKDTAMITTIVQEVLREIRKDKAMVQELIVDVHMHCQGMMDERERNNRTSLVAAIQQSILLANAKNIRNVTGGEVKENSLENEIKRERTHNAASLTLPPGVNTHGTRGHGVTDLTSYPKTIPARKDGHGQTAAPLVQAVGAKVVTRSPEPTAASTPAANTAVWPGPVVPISAPTIASMTFLHCSATGGPSTQVLVSAPAPALAPTLAPTQTPVTGAAPTNVPIAEAAVAAPSTAPRRDAAADEDSDDDASEASSEMRFSSDDEVTFYDDDL